MSYPLSLDIQQKQAPNLKQMQRLIMSPQMQQALYLLQLPIMELSTLVEEELEQNPVLETQLHSEDDEDSDIEDLENEHAETDDDPNSVPDQQLVFNDKEFDILKQLDEEFGDLFKESGPAQRARTTDEDKLQTFIESSIQAKTSLYEHLIQQAHEIFSDEEEINMAEIIIGHIDAKGYLTTPLAEIAQLSGYPEAKLRPIVQTIQTFEPSGVGAATVQEALLVQLRNRGRPKTLAYDIIDSHYEDLLHNRIPSIQKGLGCTVEEIAQAIKEDIARLDLHPGTWYSREPVQHLIPDVVLTQQGESIEVVVNEDNLPPFSLNQRYLKMLEDETLNKETKEFIRQKVMSAKWLMRNIFQRHTTLEKIAGFLAKKQKDFFLDPEGKLAPLTMQTIADELELHESTIARAVANKYIDTPRGIFPLRFFFTNAYVDSEGKDISSQTVRDVLTEIIRTEDKRKPYSDEALAAQIKARGIACARRTVAKYRALLNLGNAHQRKQF